MISLSAYDFGLHSIHRKKVNMKATSFFRLLLVIVILIAGLALIGPMTSLAGAAGSLELIARIPATGGIAPYDVEAIQVLDQNPSQIVLATRNQGLECGYGTPETIWKLTVVPGTVATAVIKQHLSEIQTVRRAVFESSDGTLFTGSGWCGYKPPYYSTDAGETWQIANVGESPPNSTFSYVEFQGQVYVGTGYDPWPAEVYRWLGGGTWQRVHVINEPRTIIESMAVYHDELFVSSLIYGYGDCTDTVPVYVSSDGTTYNATSGIPSCYTVSDVLVSNNTLVALTYDPYNDPNATQRFVYRWNGAGWVQVGIYGLQRVEAIFPFQTPPRPLVGPDGAIYDVGKLSGAVADAVYRSADLGLTWQLVSELSGIPPVTALHLHATTLYLGTYHDASNTAYLYKVELGPTVTEVALDIKPGSSTNPINLRSRGVITVAIFSTATFDASTVDPASVKFGPNGATSTQNSLEDVNGDGRLDLVLHFRTQETGIQLGDTQACLTGQTRSGESMQGCDSIRPQ
jgi:hypothetical protein